MIIPKGTPIIVYNGTILGKTESLPGEALHLSKTTRDIRVTDHALDKLLDIKLHIQLSAVCVIHGIGSMGTIDLFAHFHGSDADWSNWYLFTSKKYLK